MTKKITKEIILPLQKDLETHPIYEAIKSIKDLRCFMEHHIYCVWDFMSLLKYLQSIIAPTKYPWTPKGNTNIKRFINELILEEESDETNIPGKFSSHYELYQKAMLEIGANTIPSSNFIRKINNQNIKIALDLPNIPYPSKIFMIQTFQFLKRKKPHEIASALALGREHIIPCMFRSILHKINISEKEAPIFHFYLSRHIHLDEDFHAPLSLKLLNNLCAEDDTKIQEAINTANIAIMARIKFWDGVLNAINFLNKEKQYSNITE